jgi:hypothetical protein
MAEESQSASTETSAEGLRISQAGDVGKGKSDFNFEN